MFTINLNIDDSEECSYLDVCLRYNNDNGTNFVFIPENTEAIKDIEISDTGSFDTSPSNGICAFSWDSQSLFFQLGKFGDGNGGSLCITLRNTPEVLQSLKGCLTLWKEANAKIQQN
jgi:hypothetical protein